MLLSGIHEALSNARQPDIGRTPCPFARPATSVTGSGDIAIAQRSGFPKKAKLFMLSLFLSGSACKLLLDVKVQAAQPEEYQSLQAGDAPEAPGSTAVDWKTESRPSRNNLAEPLIRQLEIPAHSFSNVRATVLTAACIGAHDPRTEPAEPRPGCHIHPQSPRPSGRLWRS